MLSLGGKKIRKSPRSQEKLKVGAGCIFNMQLRALVQCKPASWSLVLTFRHTSAGSAR